MLVDFAQNGKGVVAHLESRPSKQKGMQFDVLAKVDISRRDLLILIRTLRQSAILGEVTVLTDNAINVKGTLKTIFLSDTLGDARVKSPFFW